MSGWRYIATRLNGDGTEVFLSWDVPLQGAAIVDDLSGPGGIAGNISPEIARLQTVDGDPVFLPWSTAIYAEKDGHIRGGAILADLSEDGPRLSLDCVGFSGYLQGQPYTGDLSKVGVDPLAMARELWAHKQKARGGNLGMVLDSTASTVRIGTAEKSTEFTTGTGEDVAFDSGPYVLNWWSTHDMGGEFDSLAASTPFDYQVVHAWSGETISHRMKLGYPTLGRRRDDLRFMVGENVFVVPKIEYSGDAYASEAIVLGAGEGRKMIRGTESTVSGRLHRAVVVEDKSLTTKQAAQKVAASEVKARLGDADIDELVVREHPHAALGSFSVGDEIRIDTRDGWSSGLSLWVRILSMKTEPDLNKCTLTVARVEKVT
ncbi:hypothetical protein KKR91_01110 [Arthrobacter jiangjiafuii]|uniref:Minor tail protein n=1 Tax=Arthrobacter jiangjiafuii TaxID=2817475 RepID=A0A975M5C6_9MICC|nr:hypothetical protein [Arthrobacter jiangjiafuii]MBP3044894.1 hypothetical protein [Arthrobacter jiangjiafuii]QWC10283.1 hypothetical protein KKR91_01110 [Arthrobacter jiangjiafuii]